MAFGSGFSVSGVADSRALGVLQALEESIKVVKRQQEGGGGGGEGDEPTLASPFSPSSSSSSSAAGARPRPVEYFASIITAMTSQPVPTGSELLRLLSMALPFVPAAVLQSRLATAARAIGGELAKATAARSQGGMGKGLFLSMVKWGMRCSLEVVRSHHEIHSWDGAEGGSAHSVSWVRQGRGEGGASEGRMVELTAGGSKKWVEGKESRVSPLHLATLTPLTPFTPLTSHSSNSLRRPQLPSPSSLPASR